MRQITITENEAGQRFDKFLFKYLKEAKAGFIYKMLRKKNIVLNGKKADGKEKIHEGDLVKFFMADETIEKFCGAYMPEIVPEIALDIVYEDLQVLIINKPVGMLSQKAAASDISANEYILSYLVCHQKISKQELLTFRPSVCNRLDRNTSGLLIAGKTLRGLQVLSELLKTRAMDKYYLALVEGRVSEKTHLRGYLVKDEKTNTVSVSETNTSGILIETEYEPVEHFEQSTLLKIKLITGKPHQIRAHLASKNHAVIGDYKYGNRTLNRQYKERFGLGSQLLHAWKIKFHEMPEGFEALREKELTAELPELFGQIIEWERKNGR